VSVVRTLVAGAIDYAGLFPPATLPMAEAVRSYAGYRASPEAWALGRFVIPVARLEEFAAAAAGLAAEDAAPWPLALLTGKGGADDWEDARAADVGHAVIRAIELRASTPEDVVTASGRLPSDVDVFFEIPVESDPCALVRAIGRARRKAKVRTGGVTADAFPDAPSLARFVVACARAGVPFKATAGLHHPLRATYRLTYDPDSASGDMFGFLNVLLAAGFAGVGLGEECVAEVLEERRPGAIRFDPAGVEWRGHRLTTADVARTRATLALSFGSCSFREPIEELQSLGLL